MKRSVLRGQFHGFAQLGLGLRQPIQLQISLPQPAMNPPVARGNPGRLQKVRDGVAGPAIVHQQSAEIQVGSGFRGAALECEWRLRYAARASSVLPSAS